MRAAAALGIATLSLAGCQWLAAIDSKFDPGSGGASSTAGAGGAAGGGAAASSGGGGSGGTGGGGGFMCPEPPAVQHPPCLTMCSGNCTDTTTDPQHCGSCSVACDPGVRCETGICGRSLFRGPGSDSLAAVKRDDGTLWSWGENGNYEGGDGFTDVLYQPTHAVLVPGCLRYSASSNNTTCVLTAPGAVDCFGNNGVGQIGNSMFNGHDACDDVNGCVATAFPTFLGDVAEIAGAGWWLGGWHFCARSTAGKVSCWGDVTSCPQRTELAKPTPIEDVDHVVMLAATAGADCMLVADGTVWCHGSNCGGQLGQGDVDPRIGSVQVPGLSGVTVIGGGLATFCARASDGVYCWGQNTQAQVGAGSSDQQVLSPLRVSDAPGFEDVVQIVGSAETMFALTAGGEVFAWGRGDFGIAGNGSPGSDPCPSGGSTCYGSPTKASVSDVVEIAAGDTTVIVRLRDGSLFGWGGNNRGQLGLGVATDIQTLPVQIPGFP